MKICFSLLFSTCFFFSHAQNCINDTLKQQLVRDWKRAKIYTQEYLDAVPADKYGFRPIDSMRTFADQMLHLASSVGGLVSIGTGTKNPFAGRNLEKSPTTQGRDSVEYLVAASYDFAIDAIQNMDFSKLVEIVKRDLPGGKRSETRLGWLLKAFEHQTHHRGQTTVYLRLLNIKPPVEKLY